MFKVYGVDKKEIFLKLAPGSAPGSVRVEACDKDGNVISHIFKISTEGKLHRYRNVNKDIGFQLDEEGRVKLD